jgi:hypothetical protein
MFIMFIVLSSATSTSESTRHQAGVSVHKIDRVDFYPRHALICLYVYRIRSLIRSMMPEWVLLILPSTVGLYTTPFLTQNIRHPGSGQDFVVQDHFHRPQKRAQPKYDINGR